MRCTTGWALLPTPLRCSLTSRPTVLPPCPRHVCPRHAPSPPSVAARPFLRRRRHVPRAVDAEFYETFSFQTWLPGASELRIRVMDYDTIGGDDTIGETTIDLEDRVFNKEWQSLSLKPIEWRPLYGEKSTHAQGRLRLWVDVSPHEE